MASRAAAAVPFRLDAARLARAAGLFNARAEIRWFNFSGAFEQGDAAAIRFQSLHEGLRGGGGTQAVNGGVIAAGFDAAAVMAGLGHYETDTVVDAQGRFRPDWLALYLFRRATRRLA